MHQVQTSTIINGIYYIILIITRIKHQLGRKIIQETGLNRSNESKVALCQAPSTTRREPAGPESRTHP